MANCSRCQVPERECICGGAQIEALTQELAAVRAELEKMREERNESDSRLRSVLRSDPLKAGVDAERARMAAEKERDEARASMLVLVEGIKWMRDWPNSGQWTRPSEMAKACLGNLPAASLALLREVEALKLIVREARYVAQVCDHPQLTKDIAALDAVEAGKK